MVGNDPIPVLRNWQDNAAPTGEGSKVDTVDGTTWTIVPQFVGPQNTGDRRGIYRDGKVHEIT